MTGSGFLRLEFEFRRFAYTLGKHRRQRLMAQLEEYNDDLRKLLGNSDRLEPMRKRRRSNFPKIFEQFRVQASSLHAAITKAVPCDCTSPHSTKLLLSRDDRKLSIQSAAYDPPEPVKLSVYFPLVSRAWSGLRTLVGPDDSWCAAEVGMVTGEDYHKSRLLPGSDDASSVLSTNSKYVDRRSRKVSFQSSVERKSSLSSMAPKDAVEILDLCAALKQHDGSQPCLGLLRDDEDRYHAIHIPQNGVVSASQIRRVVTLDTLLTQHESSTFKLPRRMRLAIALIMAKSLLQLHPGPWLKEAWGKKDIYFFETHSGEVQTNHLLLVSNFISNKNSPATTGRSTGATQNTSKSSLLCLGILILELWFNQTIESLPFRQQFFGPNGRENEYTNFNTAQKWQEQALEEGGLDLHNLTRRCVYCAFGATSQDLNDQELRRAVYDEVVEALERLLARYEEV
jgi:hypothetical protein